MIKGTWESRGEIANLVGKDVFRVMGKKGFEIFNLNPT